MIYGLITSGLILTNHDDSYLAKIIPERVSADGAAKTRGAPPTMMANLLLRHVDGQLNLRDLRRRLGCGESELIEEFNLLKRTGWIQLAAGHDTYERFFR